MRRDINLVIEDLRQRASNLLSQEPSFLAVDISSLAELLFEAANRLQAIDVLEDELSTSARDNDKLTDRIEKLKTTIKILKKENNNYSKCVNTDLVSINA